MARKATGGVRVTKTQSGTTYAIRFRVNGKREFETLGTAEEGWTLALAEEALANTLADVRRGIWQRRDKKPTQLEPEAPKVDPTFHEFASEWFDRKRHELRQHTVDAYKWELVDLLLPYFANFKLSEINAQAVDNYKTYMLRRNGDLEREYAAWRVAVKRAPKGQKPTRPLRPLKPESINKSIARLAQILQQAVEYGLIPTNPAAGKNRRLKADKPQRSYLDRAAQIDALLEAAKQIDGRNARDRHISRFAMLAVFLFAGLRISELQQLRWRAVDLAAGRLNVLESAKTTAGFREVELMPVLREILSGLKASRPSAGPNDLVFFTRKGNAPSQGWLRLMLREVVEEANVNIATQFGTVPLPNLTPHSLRRTACSVWLALGRPVPDVMEMMGHTHPAMTLGVYARAMRLGADEKAKLRELVGENDAGFALGITAPASPRIDPNPIESGDIARGPNTPFP